MSLTNFERRFSQHGAEKIRETKTGKETLLSIRATAEILQVRPICLATKSDCPEDCVLRALCVDFRLQSGNHGSRAIGAIRTEGSSASC